MKDITQLLYLSPRAALHVVGAALLIIAAGSTAEACPKAYVANARTNDVAVIDTCTNTVIMKIPVGHSPGGIAVSPKGDQVFVTSQDDNNVSVISTASNTVTGAIPVGLSPFRVGFSPDGAYAWVTNQTSNTVSVIHTAAKAVIATVPVGIKPAGVEVSPDGKQAYVTNLYSGTVSVIDATSYSLVNSVSLGVGPAAVAFNGPVAYIPNQWSNTLSVVQSGVVTATLATGHHPHSAVISPDGSRLYVCNSNDSTVSVFNTSTNSLVATISVGTLPFDAAITPDGSQLYVANFYENSVTVINTASNTVTTTLSNVGLMPAGIAIVAAAVSSPPPPPIVSPPPPGSNLSLTATPNPVMPGAPLSLTWTGPPTRAAKDWLGLSAAGTTFPLGWMVYTGGAPGGTVTLTAPTKPGLYEFTYYSNDTYTIVGKSAAFTVGDSSANPYSLTAPATARALGPLSVAFTAPSGRPATDWVALYKIGAQNNYLGLLWMRYTGGVSSATYQLTSPALAGQYEFRYFLQDAYNLKQTSNAVAVQ